MSYDSDGLQRFLKLVGQTSVLTKQQEVELFKELEKEQNNSNKKKQTKKD